MQQKSNKLMQDFILAILFVLAVTALVYYATHAYILDRAKQNIENLVLSQRGLHHYIQKVMHPAFFQAIENGDISKSYYTPEIFSSTFIVRTMHGFYNEELVKHGRPEIRYKLASENPRNPLNKADEHELQVLALFNKNRALKEHSDIISINGKKFLHYSIPFLENGKPCMRCHGKKEDAPLGLLARYPGNGGFNEKIGNIRAIESILMPLHKEYEAMLIVFASIFTASLSLLGLYWFSRRLRQEVDNKTKSLQEELTARKQAETELHIQTRMLEEEIAERQKTEEELHKAKEIAESANRAKTTFLANMSHELRTPLNGVIGMAQLLSISGVTEEQQEYLDTLQYSADNLITLINDILDISKIEAEHFQLIQSEFSLRGCLDEVLMMQQTRIAEKQLLIEKDVPDLLPDIMLCDRKRIMQVISNLLSNAIKFTEKGSIKLAVAVNERHGSTILLDISVTDTGIGIEPELLDYIFNIFTQADESYTRRYGGAGLGLALSRKLAEHMGGSITVESKVGKGSTFHLIVPCTVSSNPDSSKTDNSIDLPVLEKSRNSLSVLLAEDNPQNSLYAEKLLKRLGHQVMIAKDGKKTLEAWENNSFDLILMDIQMPEINGDEVVKIIRQREGKKHIPIIAVTAHAMMGDREKLQEAGCDGYISKPFRIETVVEEIRKVMG
jgi:signal transduction histidine kinase